MLKFDKAAFQRRIELTLSNYGRQRSDNPVLRLRDYTNRAARASNSADERLILLQKVRMSLIQANENDNYSPLVVAVAEAIRAIDEDESRFKDTLIELMEYIAKSLLVDSQHVAAAKEAFGCCDEYFNRTVAKDFVAYSREKILQTTLNKAKDFVAGRTFESKKSCAVWADYIAAKIEFCHVPITEGGVTRIGYVDNYVALLADMTAILNTTQELDDDLKELILKVQEWIISRFTNLERLPHICDYWQAVLGSLEPVCSQSNPDSIFKTLQRKAAAYNDVTDKIQKETSELLAGSALCLKNWQMEQKVVRDNNKLNVFYLSVKKQLISKILASKVLASGFLPLPQGQLGRVGNLAANAIEKLPIPGAGLLAQAVNRPMQFADVKNVAREFNNAAEITETIQQIDELAEMIADKLTLRFIAQIQKLALDADAEVVTLVAGCAVERIFEYIKSGKAKQAIATSKLATFEEIAELLAMSVSDVSILHGWKIPVLNIGLAMKNIEQSITHSEQFKFNVEELFYCPGIVVITDGCPTYYYKVGLMPNGAHAGSLSMIDKYGFMVGNQKEVEKWQLMPVPAKYVPQTEHPAVSALKAKSAEKSAASSAVSPDSSPLVHPPSPKEANKVPLPSPLLESKSAVPTLSAQSSSGGVKSSASIAPKGFLFRSVASDFSVPADPNNVMVQAFNEIMRNSKVILQKVQGIIDSYRAIPNPVLNENPLQTLITLARLIDQITLDYQAINPASFQKGQIGLFTNAIDTLAKEIVRLNSEGHQATESTYLVDHLIPTVFSNLRSKIDSLKDEDAPKRDFGSFTSS